MDVPILITGARGMLGTDLVEISTQKYGKKNVIGLNSQTLDITNLESITKALNTHQPKILINAAAYTNVDGAETETEKARQINAKGPALLAKACEKRQIVLVHFSTDQVFDGSGRTPR